LRPFADQLAKGKRGNTAIRTLALKIDSHPDHRPGSMNVTGTSMSGQLRGPEPILCAHLLRKVDDELITLLQALEPGEWGLQTIAPPWTVRDVAAHLLDTALRKLSLVRDSCSAEVVENRSPEDIVRLVNRLNREGVTVYRRLSPLVLIQLMKMVCDQNAEFHEALDLFSPARFPVAWAGEALSLNWFDTARELTERWHHQQQIRLATDRPGIMTPELYHPVLDCFVRGLPHAYREAKAPGGTTVMVEISGDCGGKWFLFRGSTRWDLVSQTDESFASRVMIPQELASRIFTKGIDRASARRQIEIEGERDLGEKVLNLTAIVA
jgi:uncharacterized protein (TIGR03083 family)